MRMWLGGVVLLIISGALAYGDAVSPARQRLQETYPGVQFYSVNEQLTRVYGVPFSLGLAPEASAELFIQNHADVFGLTPAELVPGNAFNRLYTQPVMVDRQTGEPKFTLLYYTQERDGLPVFRGELRVLTRNIPGFPVVWAGSAVRALGDFRVPAGAPANVNEGAAHAAAIAAVPGLKNFSPSELVIFAGTENVRATPTVALSFVGDNGLPATPDYVKWLFVADAATGAILFQENQILHTDVTGYVHGLSTTPPKADECNPEVDMVMPYAKVAIGSTVAYTDVNGNFTIPNGGSSPVTVTSYIDGQYFNVFTQAGSMETLTLSVTPPGPALFVHNAANTDQYIRAQVNGYIQSNVVRDFTLVYNPTYPTVFNQTGFDVNVNISSTCNAYYDGSSINFFSAGGGCNNTAFSDVVHHEYGHHLVQCAGSGQGAYGEGMSDCVGQVIADDPVVGYGFYQGVCDSGIRTAVNNMQYPCSGEIHYCGQLLSGCVWSTRNELLLTHPDTYREIIADLTINSILLHTGDGIDPSITIDFLTIDDTDGDLTNGTPHWNQICAGFTAHNMDCPPLDPLSFDFPNGQPAVVSPAGSSTVRLAVLPLGSQPQPNSGMFYCQIDGAGYVATSMTEVSPNVYEATFPASTCSSKLDYYFSVQTTAGQTVFEPENAPAAAYAAIAGYQPATPYQFNFEGVTPQGWLVGDTGDNATMGIWNRFDPEATLAQPGDDHTPGSGTKCWVTDFRAGISVNQYDVDGGKTTLKSPSFNLASYENAWIGYWRWFSNNQGGAPYTDTFVVDISNDGGATWVNAETVGPAGSETAGGWYFHQFDVSDFVPLTSQVRLRFVAQDQGVDSTIEAALDDLVILTFSCTPPFLYGDLNCNGSVGFDDINAYVQYVSSCATWQAAYPSCPPENGDINQNGQHACNGYPFDDINAFVALVSGGN